MRLSDYFRLQYHLARDAALLIHAAQEEPAEVRHVYHLTEAEWTIASSWFSAVFVKQ